MRGRCRRACCSDRSHEQPCSSATCTFLARRGIDVFSCRRKPLETWGSWGGWLAGEDHGLDEGDFQVEEVLAHEAGQLCVSLVYHRLLRTLHLSAGWPSLTARWLRPATAAATTDRFVSDLRGYEFVVAHQDQHPRLEQLARRSVFVRQCVKQLVDGFRSEGGLTEGFKDHLRMRLNRLCSTLQIEEGFNVLKNSGTLAVAKRVGRVDKLMGLLVAKQLFSSRNSFKDLAYSAAPENTADEASCLPKTMTPQFF